MDNLQKKVGKVKSHRFAEASLGDEKYENTGGEVLTDGSRNKFSGDRQAGRHSFLPFYYWFLLIVLFIPSACAEDKLKIIEVDDEEEIIDEYEGIPFSNVPSVDDIVMYEVNPLLFGSSNCFQNIITRLDNIRDLGVNVLWLMPIHPIGEVNSVNSPYSVKNFKEVNPAYGNLNDLRQLVNEAHNRGMAVIIDWVANHTSWDNPWIANKSWYTQDASGNIIIPPGTNWNDVADLNFDNSYMRNAMIDAMKYWILKANIDGFRCDAADMVPFAFWKQAITELKKIPGRDLVLLAEGARKDHFDAGFQLIYGWDFYNALKKVYINGHSAATLASTQASEYNSVAAGKRILRFTTNHDESAWDGTPVALLGSQQAALSAFAVVVSSGGVPLLYSSQEVGAGGTIPFFYSYLVRWEQNPEVLAMYIKLMDVYSGSTALRKGTFSYSGNANVWLAIREKDQERVAVLVNTRNTISSVVLPALLANRELVDQLTGNSYQLGEMFEMSANQFLIFKIVE